MGVLKGVPMMHACFENRDEAGRLLAARLKGTPMRDPLVLAIPRGGIEVAAPIARELDAELDVVLSRKIGAPFQPELALGAVAESGEVYLNERALAATRIERDAIDAEKAREIEEIARRARLFRGGRPRASVAGRSVIVTDDGIATGSTMLAALQTLRREDAFEIIVAVPVAPADRLEEVSGLCDRVVSLLTPDDFWAVGQFYRDFDQVSDERVAEVLQGRGKSETRQTRSNS